VESLGIRIPFIPLITCDVCKHLFNPRLLNSVSPTHPQARKKIKTFRPHSIHFFEDRRTSGFLRVESITLCVVTTHVGSERNGCRRNLKSAGPLQEVVGLRSYLE
jgi:hypothetical protein